MAQSQQVPQPTQLTYVDRPEISEAFADSLYRVTFDNMVVKLEFVVNRMDDPNPPAPPTGRATTAARLVIPLTNVFDMLTKLQTLLAQLQAAGIIQPISNPPTSGRPN